MTPTETTEKAKLGRPRKNPTAMVAQTGPDASITKAIAAKAAATIFKVCKQKPLQPSYSTMPHLPSGSTIIDLLIGGSKARDGGGYTCPGYPRRRITEVYGAESSGKTTIALAAIADCQRKGGVAMFLDFEHALHHGYAKTIGVDFSPEHKLHVEPEIMAKLEYAGVIEAFYYRLFHRVDSAVPAFRSLRHRHAFDITTRLVTEW